MLMCVIKKNLVQFEMVIEDMYVKRRFGLDLSGKLYEMSVRVCMLIELDIEDDCN